jgi:hypothetical protein
MNAPIAHRQVGTHDEVVVFERDLVELTHHLGRPHPEIRGFCLFDEGTRELSWLVIGQVHGKETPPTSEEITCEMTERTWGDGVMCVLHHALSHLIHLHYTELLGTRYEYYGRIDHEGFPFQTVIPTLVLAKIKIKIKIKKKNKLKWACPIRRNGQCCGYTKRVYQ